MGFSCAHIGWFTNDEREERGHRIRDQKAWDERSQFIVGGASGRWTYLQLSPS